MTELHKNLIDGEWVGTDGVENINPSNLKEVVGVYARATVAVSYTHLTLPTKRIV